MNIALVIPTLFGGGAERAAVLVTQGLAEKGHRVTVVTLSGTEGDAYDLPRGVARIALDMPADSPTKLHAVGNNIRRVRSVRRAVLSARPDAAISFTQQMNVVAILSLAAAGCPVIAVEQTDPTMHDCGALWERLRRITYPYAAQIVSVSRGVDRFFGWLPPSRRTVIYNPLADVDDERDASGGAPAGIKAGGKRIVAMGRLTSAKAFDLLLAAFKRIAADHPEWQLLILGEGELRGELEKLRDELGLAGRAFLPGRLSNPFPVLKNSQLFVLSSRFEGFGNVLIEAMACGVPVISTDCPSGPAEIIRDGENGVLVPSGDEAALAAAMDRLMSDAPERDRLAARGREVRERFGLEQTMRLWEDVLNRIAKPGGSRQPNEGRTPRSSEV